MALDRTWYNTLVDDDGSNTVGTLWNKAAVDSLMDAVDAQIGTPSTAGHVLASNGAGVDPSYQAVPAPSGMVKVLNRNVTPASNVTTGETTLMTYTLPGGTLAATGDSVRIRAYGVFAANGNTKIMKLYFGSTLLVSYSATPNNISFLIEAEVSRTGAATQVGFGGIQESTSGTIMLSVAPTETLSGDVIIKLTGQSGTASTDITAKSFVIELMPAA